LYASDLFSAARHHPQLDGTLLTAKSMKDAVDLARAGRVIGGDLTGIELVHDHAAYATKAKAVGNRHGNGHTKEGEFDTDEASPITPEPVVAANGNGLAHHYQPIEVVVEEVDGESPTPGTVGNAAWVKAREPEVLDVSEADIARIVPRVMTHRLRVRDGPEDELLASARFPAVSDDDENDGVHSGRITIKEILVRILAEV
jgi:hypothetical protein